MDGQTRSISALTWTITHRSKWILRRHQWNWLKMHQIGRGESEPIRVSLSRPGNRAGRNGISVESVRGEIEDSSQMGV